MALAKMMRRRSVQPCDSSPVCVLKKGAQIASRASGLRWKLRKMFSIRITDASTMIPKSTAPTESKLADCPVATRMMMLKNRAEGCSSRR